MARDPSRVGGRAWLPRVVLVEGNRDGTVGGSFQCAYDLARHLARAGRYEPVVVFWDDNRFASALRTEGIEVHLLRGVFPTEAEPATRANVVIRGARLAAAIARRRRFLRQIGASLVHLNNSPESGFDDWLPAARLLRIPIVSHARADAEGRLGPLGRFLVSRFDRVIAISRHVAGTLGRDGVLERRVRQIYDGIDLDALRSAAAAPLQESAMDSAGHPGCSRVLMAGNLKRWKGQHVLLEAIGSLPAPLRERCQVLLAGAVPVGGEAYVAELRQQIERLRLQDQVQFLGARHDVPALMSAADVVVHASVRPEPFGLVVVESMALGKPTVASRLGGPAETVTPDSGILFDPSRPSELAAILQRLLEDASYRSAFSGKARERAEQFSIQRNVTAIQALYDELLGERSGA
jgi:glycosyltransferase involved in cell wall biosynthesis